MAYRLEIVMNGCPTLPNRKSGCSPWKDARERRGIREKVRLLTFGKRPASPLSLARVRVIVHNKLEPDPDNLVASIKGVLDALQPDGRLQPDSRYRGSDIITDDCRKVLAGGAAEVSFVKLEKGERPHTVVIVEEVERE